MKTYTLTEKQLKEFFCWLDKNLTDERLNSFLPVAPTADSMMDDFIEYTEKFGEVKE